ncbi:unnamed protein product [Urochloa humidicola]
MGFLCCSADAVKANALDLAAAAATSESVLTNPLQCTAVLHLLRYGTVVITEGGTVITYQRPARRRPSSFD